MRWSRVHLHAGEQQGALPGGRNSLDRWASAWAGVPDQIEAGRLLFVTRTEKASVHRLELASAKNHLKQRAQVLTLPGHEQRHNNRSHF